MTLIIHHIKEFDVIIIGGGAAGLMCAATAAYRGKRVLVIDHANKVGKKILMSGGGRCNFTNYFIEPENYISENAHFCKSALSRYTQWDFIALVDNHQLAYHEKTKGQLFCDHKAIDILNILLNECEKSGVTINTKCTINNVQKHKNIFKLETNQGKYHCNKLVVATGGLSIPTMGASDFGFKIAQKFNLHVTALQPSLVPFTVSDQNHETLKSLSGILIFSEVSCNDQTFTDDILFTHRGLSGPAILQITNYWNIGDTVTINFFPNTNLNSTFKAWRAKGKKSSLKQLLSKTSEYAVAKQFVEEWLGDSASLRACDLSNDQIESLCNRLQNFTLKPSGTEGWRTAEVTRGGIHTREVSSKTFEAKKVKGLYFIGEVLDVTGWLGGFNFQWAWASGYCAGQHL